MTILIVDDHELQRKTTAARLKKNGHTVVEASNGLDALEILQKKDVDAVISDVLMPRMDGYELCQQVRKSKQLSSLPFILYSAIYTGEDDENTALSSGADRFFVKPVPEAELLKALQELWAEEQQPHRPLKRKQRPHLKEYSARLVNRLEETVDALQRRNAELETAERRFRILTKTISAGLLIYTKNEILYATPAAEDLTGYSYEELCALKPLDLIFEEDRPSASRRLFMGDGFVESSSRLQVRMLTKTFAVRWVDFSASIVEYEGSNAVVGTLLDITNQKQAEHELKQQASLLDVDPAAIYVLDRNGLVVFWNKSAERIYGWKKEEILGKPFVDRLKGEAQAQIRDGWKSVFADKKWTATRSHKKADGAAVILESDWTLIPDSKGNPDAVYIVDSDITERKKLEEQFLRSQRMENLGMVAGGIAHDLNNILAPILLSIQIARKPADKESMSRLLDVIESSAKRGSDIVKQILGFAGGRGSARTRLRVESLLREMSQFLKETFPKSVQIDQDFSKDLWHVEANPTQLNQVLMNLSINARDAMPNGGTLTLRAENFVADSHYALSAGHTPGPYVVLSVQDTGIGIASDIKDRIFEPFFSTKSNEGGTGLGLSTVGGIVRNHGGFIRVQSEPGKGATFKIHLPAVRTEKIQKTEKAGKPLAFGKGETILVVEDEVALREITKETLESYGYKVLTAGDGTEALAAFAANKGRIALVLCDLSMPFMDGPATIKALTKSDPSMKVVVVSGFAEGEQFVRKMALQVGAFIPKPYVAETLLNTIKTVLGEDVAGEKISS
ncbi:MAG TPA: response regulator [Bacteroidota bacterium]